VNGQPVADADEVELKLLAAGSRPLEILAAQAELGPARLGEAVVSDELDRYLDTADGRLGRARWACRLRTRGGRTIISLKGPRHEDASPDASLHQRPEREGPAGDGLDPARWPASGARELLRELSGDAPLVERLALRQRRTERAVLVDGTRAGILSLDRVTVIHRGERVGRLFVVELELTGAAVGDAGLITRLSAALASVSGLAPDASSKLEHAIALIGGGAAPPAAPSPRT
jgi:inorganic triphosphatase YgiF